MSSGIFGIGLGEIFFLMVLAVVLFGPEKLPEFARKAARVLHWIKNIANNTTQTLRTELGPGYEDLTLKDLNPKTFVQKHLLDELQSELSSVKNELDDVRNAINGTVSQSNSLLGDVKSSVNQSLTEAKNGQTGVTARQAVAGATAGVGAAAVAGAGVATTANGSGAATSTASTTSTEVVTTSETVAEADSATPSTASEAPAVTPTAISFSTTPFDPEAT